MGKAEMIKGHTCGHCQCFYEEYSEANDCCEPEEAWQCSECSDVNNEGVFVCGCEDK